MPGIGVGPILTASVSERIGAPPTTESQITVQSTPATEGMTGTGSHGWRRDHHIAAAPKDGRGRTSMSASHIRAIAIAAFATILISGLVFSASVLPALAPN